KGHLHETSDTLQCHPSELLTFLDPLKFFFRQFAFLEQHVVRNPDHPNVMEQARHYDVIRIRITQTQGYRSAPIVLCYAVAMTARVRVAQIDKRHECTSHRQDLFTLVL